LSKPVVTVNGRFLTMEMTGVQRYAREILLRLAPELEADLRVIVPPDRVHEGGDPDLGLVQTTTKWHGIGGHLWEQLVLPRITRKVGSGLLWSPCNWGPLSVRRQVPVIHDIAALTQPEYFTPSYRLLARALTGPLLRRSIRVITPSTRVRAEMLDHSLVREDGIEIVPPGVGPPFDSVRLDDLDRRAATYCILVGAHDSRKNVGFLLDLWPDVHARTGLELHLTRRRLVTTRQQRELDLAKGPGIVVHDDPTDVELAGLYADALCLLWPSHYEGYGFPLLEAMAVGTPFLAADVGAAAELAIVPEQVLPLERESWIDQIDAWHAGDVSALRAASARRARAQTWSAAAAATAGLLDRVVGMP
jgi:glycosyltransferase involved in cell wall biosynthesis